MAERRGPGRWCPVRKPKGALWVSASGVGFDPVPGEDPSAMTTAIAAGATFDDLAAAFGEKVRASDDLDRYTPARKAR